MNNDWLDIDVLEDYLDGKLDAKGMHFVERQALDDPFVAEALEGLRQSPKRKQTLSILQKQLYDRISEKPIRRKMWGITTQRLSIAATATVAFIAVSILFFMRETNRKNAEIAARKSQGVIVHLDSTNTVASDTPKQEDSAVRANEVSKSAFIDKAIADAKTGDLAKNARQVPVIKNAEKESEAKKIDIEYTTLKKAKAAPIATQPGERSDLNEVVVSAATQSSGSNLIYSGNVVSETGKPVQGAVVKLENSKAVTATNAAGFFTLPVDSADKDKEILIKAQGFNDKVIATNPDAIRMALSGDKSLNEIALITGSNGRKKEAITPKKIVLNAVEDLDRAKGEITKPVPVSTINYDQYLENNNRLYNPKGPAQYVVVRFKVKKNGRPANILVIKSLNKKADAEAKRLIDTGPDWVLPKNGNDLVEMSVKF
ncbi:carboxypeptidase-like regulatory domain-containing protein [Pedobacter rhodius]|uniref:Carboxypeptidase-like regulatory domain-containing protein n=1 Tax=Pedobacter rhodius TaxID=3004098 RepID=A0ABT4KZ38_9SPHI|nr:carboxypeptidase-like regulatory domain-containing protein [Pedobacter sp. SJ11]MCZ4224196.1 carboxypeptidase-like regulatory domain-containing protein [Pedobacter sp. SJ11]